MEKTKSVQVCSLNIWKECEMWKLLKIYKIYNYNNYKNAIFNNILLDTQILVW